MQDSTTRRKGMWILGGLGAILFAAAALPALGHFVGRQTVEVVVTLADTPRSCRASRILLLARPYRSSVPTQTGWAWCGLVLTDHGAITLPESGLFTSGSGRREALVDTLRNGCRYRVTVSGFGPDLEPGAMPATHGNKALLSAEPVGTCP